MKKQINIIHTSNIPELEKLMNLSFDYGWKLKSTHFNFDTEDFVAVMQLTTVEIVAKKKTAKDLILEMEYKGEKFVPLVKLFQIHNGNNYPILEMKVTEYSVYSVFQIEDNKRIHFGFTFSQNRFFDRISQNGNTFEFIEFPIKNQPQIFAALNEWGFDLTQKD